MVPGLPPPLLEAPPPQPIRLNEENSKTPSIAHNLRLLRGTQAISNSASDVPPADGHSILFRSFLALPAAVVFTISVEVCTVLPLRVNEDGLRLRVGRSLVVVGLMEQLRLTKPEYPFVPETLIVDVFPFVVPGSMERAVFTPLG